MRSWRTCHPWPLCVDYIWYGFPKRDKGESQGGPGKGTTAMFFSYCSASQSSWGASWLAGWGDYDQETYHALGWLAGGLAGWLRPRELRRALGLQLSGMCCVVLSSGNFEPRGKLGIQLSVMYGLVFC